MKTPCSSPDPVACGAVDYRRREADRYVIEVWDCPRCGLTISRPVPTERRKESDEDYTP